MNQKERLVELLREDNCCIDYDCNKCLSNIYCYPKTVADLILADGWFRPPCKVGQTVFKIEYRQGSRVKFVKETTVSRIAIDNDGIWIFCTCNPIVKCKFGKLVFLTREEAEKALKGGGEG